ncbi:UDP-N-acetylmuramoyl-tripeptide--D-alanyl-D-alanine ligase [Miltoncostaea oceani]|jgi:UDP-N-acetylmuramoyl-tripeptide--D-alanyl-D-alanine ligase|uniref:UDP-N-acetylmuramoyl-tripeptide--D-alanyl-D- alanine ligase n=1 Tax=Miltoncostaea oceani TaxID=2843216 RepID=UPI001C3C20EB|nr:UDP-N-acetylmuramoyl-tripeptide--D-alanyl-D-alanine ligase [Miltoncostaea oceani]
MRLTVHDIMRCGVETRIPAGKPDTEFEGAFVDSREVVEGGLFVGIRGEMADGGTHAPDALRDGAAAAVVGESAWRWIEGEVQGLRKPVIVTPDPVGVLQAAGRIALERSGARVVGVTGATGKTTTKDIIVAMLRAAGVAAEGTPGNRNTGIGVPMSLLGLAEDCEVAVVEMGMRGPGQIAELAALAPPDVAVITSIGPVHLELLGTVEAVAAAKAEILTALRPGGTAVVPDDEPLLDPFLATLDPGVTVVRFGDRPDLDLDLSVTKGWQLRNAAAALAVCRALGAVPPEGARIEVELSALRGQERPLPGGGILIEDCYNANPIAMRAALADLAGRPGRRVAVLADMMELGPAELDFHREIGAAAAAAGIDLLVAVGERARAYAEGAEGLETIRIDTVDEAVGRVPELIEDGDVVLLKGSRSMALERIGAALAPGA